MPDKTAEADRLPLITNANGTAVKMIERMNPVA
jgi:hypothetical protein